MRTETHADSALVLDHADDLAQLVEAPADRVAAARRVLQDHGDAGGPLVRPVDRLGHETQAFV